MVIIRAALKRPISTLMFFLVFIVFGVISISKLKVTLLPPIVYPRLTIVAVYQSVPPAEIKELVTAPIEEAVMSVNGVKRVESISREGVSIVIPSFQWGTDIDIASVDLREKLDTIKNILPRQMERPVVMRLDPSSRPIIGLGAFWSAKDSAAVKRLIEKEIKPELERQEGIARVSLKGGVKEEIIVEIDLDRMNAFGLSVEQVKKALGESTYNFPAGNIVEGKNEFLIRVDGEYKRLSDIAQTVVGMTKSGGLIKVEDIALVRSGIKDRTSYFLLNGREGIGLDIIKESGANDIAVSKRVRKVIAGVNRKFGNFLRLELVYDSSGFITESINNLLITALLAVVITFFVVLLFMRRLGLSLIITLTVPVSILISFILMYFSGMTLNIMSIGGLVLGIGMLVDNAIVIIEEIEGKSTLEDIYKGVSGVTLPIFASTSTTLIVFVPLIFVRGVAGAVFSQLALTISFSLISSIIVSIFLIPILYKLFPFSGKREEPGWFKLLLGGFRRALSFAMRRGKSLALFTIVLLAALFFLFFMVPREFMPVVDRGEFSLNIFFRSGTTIEDNRAFVSALLERLEQEKSVERVYGVIGYEEDDPYVQLQEEVGVHISRVNVILKDRRKESVFEIVEALSGMIRYREGVKVVYEIPRNVVADILNISRYDFNLELSSQLEDGVEMGALLLLSKLERSGLFQEVESSRRMGKPQVKITFDYPALTAAGLSSKDIYTLINTAVKGSKSAKYKKGDDRIDVRLRFQLEDRGDLKDLERYKLFYKESAIPITTFIKLSRESSPSKILRRDQREIIKLYGNYNPEERGAAEQVAAIIGDFSSRNRGLELSGGAGESETAESFRQLIFALLLSLFLVYALLAAQFESLLKPLFIMLAVPFSFLGSLLFLKLFNQSLNINSVLGIVMLSGIVVNNSIVLFDRYGRNIRRYKSSPTRAIYYGTVNRFKPVVMTSLTTLFGLIPMAIGIGRGGKLQTPLALSVIGGLFISTVVTLFIMPKFYYLVSGRKR